ncbi:hypothetical protein [Salinibacter ruber]|uniref:hypothetical protein n=1 Tax=Salinibacter ruber TaxID=146919 RepID=UPI000E583F23|nr:hypothetical protein [Salinibacter ruber]
MTDDLKNSDRDPEHRRRREVGSENEGPDGQEAAAALYGGDISELRDEDTETDSEQPTLFD